MNGFTKKKNNKILLNGFNTPTYINLTRKQVNKQIIYNSTEIKKKRENTLFIYLLSFSINNYNNNNNIINNS